MSTWRAKGIVLTARGEELAADTPGWGKPAFASVDNLPE